MSSVLSFLRAFRCACIALSDAAVDALLGSECGGEHFFLPDAGWFQTRQQADNKASAWTGGTLLWDLTTPTTMYGRRRPRLVLNTRIGWITYSQTRPTFLLSSCCGREIQKGLTQQAPWKDREPTMRSETSCAHCLCESCASA